MIEPRLLNHRWASRFAGANPRVLRFALALFGVAVVAISSFLAYLLHFNLSTAGSMELLLVVMAALRLGLFPATVVSIAAVVALNFFFTPPIFQLTVADPKNWVSLAIFEATALLISRLSSKVRLHARDAETQRLRSVTLYELSRSILLIDSRFSITQQLAALIREFISVEVVDLWIITEDAPQSAPAQTPNSAYATYLAGVDSDDRALDLTRRMLRLGTTPVGAMTMRGWQYDPLLADAVASLTAIAVERVRALQQENRAEAERNTEQLRTAVLDGLAHGFKTPLTAIQTASSGLLAIQQLTPTQTELVSIIDDQATMLSQLTTRLLQTAALESKEVRLRRTDNSMLVLLTHVIAAQDAATASRINVHAPPGLITSQVDAPMIELALLQLIDNAAKYSAVGRSIDVAVVQNEVETTVVVENTGSWIRPEDRERIFERFYRGVDAAHGPTGTGLGLSIVKKTAEAHGGRAWVECENDITRFHFAIQNYRKVTHG